MWASLTDWLITGPDSHWQGDRGALEHLQGRLPWGETLQASDNGGRPESLPKVLSEAPGHGWSTNKTSLRCDADIVLRNIFRALDTNNSGKISPRDLMLTFTMAMNGTSELINGNNFRIVAIIFPCSIRTLPFYIVCILSYCSWWKIALVLQALWPGW